MLPHNRSYLSDTPPKLSWSKGRTYSSLACYPMAGYTALHSKELFSLIFQRPVAIQRIKNTVAPASSVLKAKNTGIKAQIKYLFEPFKNFVKRSNSIMARPTRGNGLNPHKEELKNGIISMGHAKVLLSLDSHVSQREVCRRIVQKGLSVRETEELVKYTVSSSKKSASLSRKKNAYLSAIENELRNIFGTKVIVKNKKGKGRIEIEFYSNEELERILDTFRNIKT